MESSFIILSGRLVSITSISVDESFAILVVVLTIARSLKRPLINTLFLLSR